MVFMCIEAGSDKSTRSDIEDRLIAFLYSLKYYAQRWPRAQFFARMLGFLREKHEFIHVPEIQSYMRELMPQRSSE